MGEYTSTAKKGREIATAAMLFGVAIGVLYLSKIPNLPFPVLFQLVAVFLLVAAVFIITRYVMRRYTCRLEVNQKGSVDFVIVEHYGRRDTVVCRVYAAQIRSAVRRTKETWKQSAGQRKGKQVFHYTACFSDPDRVIAEVFPEEDGENSFFVEFAADETFLKLLQAALPQDV